MDVYQGPPPPDTSSAPLSRLLACILLAAISFVATWTVLQAAGASEPHLIEPAPDPRGFRFKSVDAASGLPLRYNPCASIHYTINPSLAPPTGVVDVHTAFEMTAEATGIRFVFDGMTNEQPGPRRAPYQPDRYGDRWAPILVAWTQGDPSLDSANTEVSGTRTIGEGGSAFALNDAGLPVYVSGIAAFDATAELPPGFGGETWGQLILHELGHVLGLGHVDDPGSVMNGTIGLRHAAWGPGDRAGLWELGNGGSCVKTPDLP
jgi:hypothetical protein